MNPVFAQVEESLREWLPQVAVESDRLLEASWPSPGQRQGFWPAALAIGRLGFTWRCRSRFEGDQSRFLFWTSEASAREMLDAELTLELQPFPRSEEAPPPPRPGATRLVFPRVLRRKFTADEFIHWTPPAAGLRRSAILRLGPDESLGAWDSREPGEEDDLAEHILARWTRGRTQRDLGPKGPWPLDLFLAVVHALASEEALLPGDARPYADLNPDLEVWNLADAALQLAISLPLLFQPDPPPLARAELEPWRTRWGIGRCDLRAGALINEAGGLAAAIEGDTFLAPFRVTWEDALEGPRLSVVLEPPDIVARGELRACLLREFAKSEAVRDLAKRFNLLAPGAQLTPGDMEAWCEPDNPAAQVVRVDRVRNGPDEYLLVLTGVASTTPVAALIISETGKLAFQGGRLEVELKGIGEVFAGAADGRDLPWKRAGQLFCDLLSIVLRWRFLLP